jgi:hypothetical protein
MTGGRSTTPVVTLFESYGSGADYIGPRVAQALGLPFHPPWAARTPVLRARPSR